MAAEPPVLSFVVPAHDEERLIANTLSAIHTSAGAASVPYEIIVADDGSNDRTAAIAADSGARVVSVNVPQIAAARNAGAAAAAGHTLVFVDAAARVTAAVVRVVLDARDRGAIGGGAVVEFDQPLPRHAREWMNAFTWASRQFGLAAGCFVFCAADVFTAVGGFR